MQIKRTSAKEAARKAEAKHRKAKRWTGLDWTGRTETTMFYGRLVHGSPEVSRLTTLYTGDGHARQNN